MPYRQITDELKKVAKEYKEDMAFASTYITNSGMYAKHASTLDVRDFAPMLTLIGIEGETREAREQDMRDKIHMLENAFTGPDPEARKPYLNMIYDLLDSVDPAKVDMNNEEQVRRLVQAAILGQTFGRKKDENPDFFNERYPSPQERALADSKDVYLMKTTAYVRTNLKSIPDGIAKNGRPGSLEIPTNITIPSAIGIVPDEVITASVLYAKLQRDKAQVALDNNLSLSTDFYEIPVLDSMVESFGADHNDAMSYDADKEFLLSLYFGSVIQENLLQTEFKNMQGMREADLVLDTDFVYVDGMPFREFKATYLPDSNLDNGDQNLSIISTLLLSPDHQLDVVHAYRGENNEMQYEAKSLKAAISPEQEKQHLQRNHSWFRLLFNWWPFRIESLQEKLDRTAADGITERHERIRSNLKERIETSLERKAEAARAKQSVDLEQEKALQATENEKQRLNTAAENAIEKYGANSAIGILGQQVKTSYDDIINGAMEGKETNRYEKMSLSLAKQVLFAQLCTERVSAGDKIGPLEQTLTGDTEDATKEKIEAAAREMAKDPVLKEVFHAMTGAAKGDYTQLGSDGARRMINSGGYSTLAKNYTEQKAAENTQNKQAEGNQKEAQGLENAQPKEPANVPSNIPS